ncbi:WhiB family transcriptional regulator [Streptomyces sp. NPDC002506]|uniref:WhiB family transcriptional regulator n=1 Tax=Streptomyces sp. NPDC002506 TaxID=3154536 RepID=UPI00331C630F
MTVDDLPMPAATRRRRARGPLVGASPAPAPLSRQAACSEADAALFYPSHYTREGLEDVLALCAGCPVRNLCLEHARTMPERFGIWAGTTPFERGWDKYGKRLNRRPAAPAGQPADGIPAADSGPPAA